MVRKITYAWILCMVAVATGAVHAQILPLKELDTTHVFTNIHEAMQSPAEVIRLDLSKQKLIDFPVAVFEFPNLQELRLNKCRLQELPDRFNEIPLLQRLACDHNDIDSIPSSLLRLQQLNSLSLADNLIEIIPDDIDRLNQLETLALWDNPITYYPERLTEMQHLKVMDVLNNAMSSETQERLKIGLPKCKIIMSPPCACMDGDE